MNTSQANGVTARMLDWVTTEVSGLGPVASVQLLAGGRSNLTYLLVGESGMRCVLRRPPLGEVLESAHDMGREWRFITALKPTSIPVAVPLAFCGDCTVCEQDFYVMDHVQGLVLGDEADAAGLSPTARRVAGESAADVLADLHLLDPSELGLPGPRAGSGGFVERQVERWSRQLSALEFAEKDLLLDARSHLLRDLPPERLGIVHGDYRLGNLSVDPSGAVVGVFDWELATVGDVMVDLGWLIASWRNPGEGEKFLPTTESPTGIEGFLSRDEVAERYSAGTGQDLEHLDWYVAFSRWRMACIAAGVRHRYNAGVMEEDGFSVTELGTLIRGLGERALAGVSPSS